MKTLVLFLLMILLTDISASDSHWEKMIIEKMLVSMTQNKEITIYSNDKHFHELAAEIQGVHTTDDCKQADFVLSHKGVSKSCTKPEIVFSYKNYLNSKYAIGVFFWQKGRPTIRFSEKRLNNFGLEVKGELSKFVSTSK